MPAAAVDFDLADTVATVVLKFQFAMPVVIVAVAMMMADQVVTMMVSAMIVDQHGLLDTGMMSARTVMLGVVRMATTVFAAMPGTTASLLGQKL